MTSQGSSQIVSVVAQNILAARVDRGYTQRQVAAWLGLDVRAVSRWERSGVIPSPSNLAALATLLGRSPGWFYTNHEERAA
jgi:transcriptional regulator with XRE-family HTH domain